MKARVQRKRTSQIAPSPIFAQEERFRDVRAEQCLLNIVTSSSVTAQPSTWSFLSRHSDAEAAAIRSAKTSFCSDAREMQSCWSASQLSTQSATPGGGELGAVGEAKAPQPRQPQPRDRIGREHRKPRDVELRQPAAGLAYA